MQLYFPVPRVGWHLTEANVKKVEDLYAEKSGGMTLFLGSFCTKRPGGGWNDIPVDVFYQSKPNKSAGHSHYFGLFYQISPMAGRGPLMITNAESCFSEPLTGAICSDGEVIISRGVHDYVERKGAMIDGGRAYTRTNGCKLARITIEDAYHFKVEAMDDYNERLKKEVESYPESMKSTFSVDADLSQIDPSARDWEYDGEGVKVWKGTRKPYDGYLPVDRSR